VSGDGVTLERRALSTKPRAFWLHVDHLENPDRDVWAVQSGRRYHTATHVQVEVPMETVFRGDRVKRQPKAYLRGKGVLRPEGAGFRITAS
jgi:hypothetical protein